MLCIAIDDEPIALTVISQFCLRKGGLKLMTFSEPMKGLEAIEKLKPGLVFLDIEMDGINGLEIAQRLPSSTCFIFTTAYLEYAVDGFDLDAVDFLHKPFSYERFEKAVDKAIRRIGVIRQEESEKNIIVKQEYNNVSIPVSDILYIEAMENYSKIFRQSQSRFVLTRNNLKSITEMLPERNFMRIHRSYIVSLDKIVSFNKKEMRLSGGHCLPIGRQYAEAVIRTLQKDKS